MANLFQDGVEASSSALMAAFRAIQDQGTDALTAIEQVQSDALLQFQRELGALNGCTRRASRLADPSVAGSFPVSDFLNIDQTLTSATVRADSGSATLKERLKVIAPVIQSQSFTTDVGSAESFTGMYRVLAPDNTIPVGTFHYQFQQAVQLRLLVLDVVSVPAGLQLQIRVSPDGVTWTEASGYNQTGYRIVVRLPAVAARYLEISATPALPDTLNGNTYTFGLTSIDFYDVEFYLQSELVLTQPETRPGGSTLQFSAEAVPGISYFLSLGGGPFVGASPNQILKVPGASTVSSSVATLSPGGYLTWKNESGAVLQFLPDDCYLPTLRVLADGVACEMAPDLNPQAVALMKQPTIAIWNGGLYPLNFANGSVFAISYTRGPAVLSSALRVQITSQDRAQSPVFTGASLLNPL